MHCPDLGGGNTGNGIGGNNTTQTFTITGSGAATTSSAQWRKKLQRSARMDAMWFSLRAKRCGTSGTARHLRRSGERQELFAHYENNFRDQSTGRSGMRDSHNPVISSDGRFVAFSSAATNLVEGSAKGKQVYIRDTCVGASVRLQAFAGLSLCGSRGRVKRNGGDSPFDQFVGKICGFCRRNTRCECEDISVGHADATNSGLRQVFLRDTCSGRANCTPKTTRISLQPGDAPANSTKPAGSGA